MASAIPYVAVVWIFLFNGALDLLNENSMLARCLKHGGWFLGCTNKKEGATQPLQYLAWDILNPEHAVSGVIPMWVLLAYRACALTFFAFIILFQGLWGSRFGRPIFSWLTFFTNWTFVGFGLYAVLGTLILSIELKKKSRNPLTDWSILHKALVLIIQSVTSSAIFLTLFYWFVIYGGDQVEFDNVARHGLNVLILTGDLLMSRIPVVTYHFQICFAYGSIYAVFMWIYYGFSGDWKYTALNWNKDSALGYYIALPFLYIFAFTLMYLVAFAREKLIVARREEGKYSQLTPPDIQMTDVAVVK